MNFRKQISILIIGLFLAVGAAGNVAAAAPDAAQAKQAITDAKAAQKKAASAKGEWRDVGKFIKKAQAAEKKGDFTTAVKLANKARQQSEIGYQQAVEQTNLALPSYLQSLY
ncbi:MAG: SoxXA-binding protein [Gammaproteobacteria bacterium]|nr:SoxXA-binding protein [Gammaproteobacteria bacterium]